MLLSDFPFGQIGHIPYLFILKYPRVTKIFQHGRPGGIKNLDIQIQLAPSFNTSTITNIPEQLSFEIPCINQNFLVRYQMTKYIDHDMCNT